MYLKIIEQKNYKNIEKLFNCSKNNIIVIKYYDNIYVILNLKNYNIIFLVKYKIHNSSDVEDIYNCIRLYLMKNITNSQDYLRWQYYYKCKNCSLSNLINLENNKSIKNISEKPLQKKELIVPGNQIFSIDNLNKNPNLVYKCSQYKKCLYQCEYCQKYDIYNINDIKFRENLASNNYFKKQIAENSYIKEYNIFSSNNNKFLFINLSSCI